MGTGQSNAENPKQGKNTVCKLNEQNRRQNGTKKGNNKHKILAVDEEQKKKKGKRQQKEMRQRQTVRKTRQSMFKSKLRLLRLPGI